MKFLIIPDSFKGALSAKEFCGIADGVIKSACKSAQTVLRPVSDGGENSVEYLTELMGGKLFPCKVTDANFFTKQVNFGAWADSAVISVASCAGLADTMIKNPLYTTTYGVGEQIKRAKLLKKKNIYLCLGGSATNDGGAGMACALGAKFYDGQGNTFVPTGGTLAKIKKTDLSELRLSLDGLKITALCDVTNPLLGEMGCSRVYAPQKGASPIDVETLEENMKAFVALTYGLADPDFSGSGAAGGVGYAVKAFLKGELTSGIGYFLDAMDFEREAADCDYIITGEGRFDRTSIMGKVCAGIMERSKNIGAKIVVFCGANALEVKPERLHSVIQISDGALSLAENIANTAINLKKAVENFLKEEMI